MKSSAFGHGIRNIRRHVVMDIVHSAESGAWTWNRMPTIKKNLLGGAIEPHHPWLMACVCVCDRAPWSRVWVKSAPTPFRDIPVFPSPLCALAERGRSHDTHPLLRILRYFPILSLIHRWLVVMQPVEMYVLGWGKKKKRLLSTSTDDFERNVRCFCWCLYFLPVLWNPARETQRYGPVTTFLLGRRRANDSLLMCT